MQFQICDVLDHATDEIMMAGARVMDVNLINLITADQLSPQLWEWPVLDWLTHFKPPEILPNLNPTFQPLATMIN